MARLTCRRAHRVDRRLRIAGLGEQQDDRREPGGRLHEPARDRIAPSIPESRRRLRRPAGAPAPGGRLVPRSITRQPAASITARNRSAVAQSLSPRARDRSSAASLTSAGTAPGSVVDVLSIVRRGRRDRLLPLVRLSMPHQPDGRPVHGRTAGNHLTVSRSSRTQHNRPYHGRNTIPPEVRMRRRFSRALLGAALALLLVAGPTLACGGLIGPNGAVNLLRTTTFAGYHDGVEHYVTAFQFAGGGGAFGSITPLPGVPSKVEKGGDWTLQRLVRETGPQLDAARATGAARRRRGGGDHEGPDRCPRRDRPQGRVGGGRQVGRRSRLPAPPGRAGGSRVLRQAQPHLPRRRVRRERRQGSRPGSRRRDAGPRQHPHHRTRGSRSASSPSARPARTASMPTSSSSPIVRPPSCRPRRAQRDAPGASPPRHAEPARRPAVRPGMEWVPSGFLTKIAIDAAAAAARLRPRDRCQRPGRALVGAGRVRRAGADRHRDREHDLDPHRPCRGLIALAVLLIVVVAAPAVPRQPPHAAGLRRS